MYQMCLLRLTDLRLQVFWGVRFQVFMVPPSLACLTFSINHDLWALWTLKASGHGIRYEDTHLSDRMDTTAGNQWPLVNSSLIEVFVDPWSPFLRSLATGSLGRSALALSLRPGRPAGVRRWPRKPVSVFVHLPGETAGSGHSARRAHLPGLRRILLSVRE